MRLRKTLTFLTLATALVFASSAWAPQKPFTRDQVQGLMRAGLGDESGAKLIEQRGIDFALAEDFLQSLKAAGASEAFLKALRAAKQPEAASAKKSLNQAQIFALLAGQVASRRVAMLVNERSIEHEKGSQLGPLWPSLGPCVGVNRRNPPLWGRCGRAARRTRPC